MKLAASEALKKLKLKHYTSLQSESDQLRQLKPFFSMPGHVEKESGVLAPKRINHVEQFKKYTYEVLPALEQTVELDLLNKIFHKVNPVARESIAQSYVRKYVESLVQRPDQAQVKGQVDDSETNIPKEKSQIFEQVNYDDWELDPYSVGMWYPFKIEEFKKIFKYKSPGDFENNFLKYSRNFSLQLTFDGLRILDYIDSSFRQPEVFDDITQEMEDLQTEAGFILMFNCLKGDLNAELRKHRSNEIFQRIFATSVNFDALIITILDNHELIQQMRSQEDRQIFCQSLVKQLLEKVDKKQANASMPDLLFKTVKSLTFKDYTIDLTKYVDNPFPVPQTIIENRFGDQYYGWGSTMLFYGDHGAGKSGLLMQAIMYAKKQNWIVAVVPSGYDWTSLKYETVRHNQTGLYMQPKAAQEWLQQFRDANEEILQNLEINPQLYGKFNLSGVHDEDPEPCPNFYDERRQYHFKDYQKFQTKQELQFEDAQDQIMSARITLRLPNPKLLLEIIDYGIENPNYATNAVYEVMEQLYNTETHQVLVVVDGINWFYKPSQVPSFRYESDKGLRGHIPPYHMSLPRLFMHFDGHKIRNGTKLTASSIYPYFQHDFQPKHVLLPQKYGIKLNGAPLDIFRMFCEYSIQTGVWKCDDYSQATIEQFWMETQGNYAETLKCMRQHWRDI